MTTETVSPIRAIRREQGMTVEALAFKAGLASATVYRAERGIGTPSDETLDALAAVLKVGVSELHTENGTDPLAAGAETTPVPAARSTKRSAAGTR